MECSPPTDRLNPCPENTAPINEECTEANRTDREQARRNPFRRRFDRITLGFWLGGLALGTGGCLFGASLPCRYPVAGVISALWWGLFCGCFGASIGALFGVWMQRRPAPPSLEPAGASKPPTRAVIDSAIRPAERADHLYATGVSERVDVGGDHFSPRRVTPDEFWRDPRPKCQKKS
jgi:hypothetical protein